MKEKTSYFRLYEEFVMTFSLGTPSVRTNNPRLYIFNIATGVLMYLWK